MYTPQEVSEKTFPKSTGLSSGYSMTAVDEFLDGLTEDYTALYKDNTTLKAKLKMLAEKVEEYRATEDAMRSTLLAAQKMAAQMVADAQAEKEKPSPRPRPRRSRSLPTPGARQMSRPGSSSRRSGIPGRSWQRPRARRRTSSSAAGTCAPSSWRFWIPCRSAMPRSRRTRSRRTRR